MSGQSSYSPGGVTVGKLKDLLKGWSNDLVVKVPSINRDPGSFIKADHVFIDGRDGEVTIDGDISEARKDDDPISIMCWEGPEWCVILGAVRDPKRAERIVKEFNSKKEMYAEEKGLKFPELSRLVVKHDVPFLK